MKQLNKLLALALAVIMVMALATTAFAEGEDNSDTDTVTITVNNALENRTYSAYKIFDVTKATDTDGKVISYAYTITSGEGDGANPFFTTVSDFATEQNGLTLTQIGTTGEYNVTFDSTKFDETKAKSLSEALYKVVTDKNNPISYTKQATGTKVSDNNVTASFTGLAEGYYLITSPIGSTCILDTTVGTKEINEKNGLPTLKKQVNQADSDSATDNWADYNDAAFGQTVQFKIEIQVDKTSDNYVLTDELPSGFTLVNNETPLITVQCAKYNSESQTYENPESISNANEDSKNYELETTNLSTNETFRITFKSAYLSQLKALDKLIITYSATVGTNATVGVGGNTNTAKLTYGTNQTKEAETKTYIWSFDVSKFVKTGTESTETPLAGATFQLSTDEAGNNPVYFMRDSTSTNYKRTDSQTQNSVSTITTSTDGDAGGKFTLQGLDSGTYYLTETAAPAGYNKLEGPIKVEIGMSVNDGGTASYTVKYANWQETVNGGTTSHYGALNLVTDNKIPVENKAGSLLPSTGGIGTTIFYVLGGILVVGAGVLLITKKRMSNSK